MPEHNFKPGDAVWVLRGTGRPNKVEWVAAEIKRVRIFVSRCGASWSAYPEHVVPRDPALNGKDRPDA